jgi:hypothetical protein
MIRLTTRCYVKGAIAGSYRFATNAIAGIVQRLNVVTVSLADARVEREIKLMDFTKWLDADRHARERIVIGFD